MPSSTAIMHATDRSSLVTDAQAKCASRAPEAVTTSGLPLGEGRATTPPAAEAGQPASSAVMMLRSASGVGVIGVVSRTGTGFGRTGLFGPRRRCLAHVALDQTGRLGHVLADAAADGPLS